MTKDIARLGPLPRAGHVIQDPLDLGGGKIGIRHQAGILADVFRHAGLLHQLVHQRGGAAALPDDGIVDVMSGNPVMSNRLCFPCIWSY